MQKTNQFDIVILGGALTGLALATSLAKFSLKVALIDKKRISKEAIKKEKRAFAISSGSKSLLEELNIWQKLEKEDFSPIKDIHVLDGTSDNFFDFSAKRDSEARLFGLYDLCKKNIRVIRK